MIREQITAKLGGCMLVSPMLPNAVVELVSSKLKNTKSGEHDIENLLEKVPIEEKVHILRFLYNRSSNDIADSIHGIWRTMIPQDHILNTSENRKALNAIGQWWDTFGYTEGMTVLEYDTLEQSLDAFGATPEGVDYFKWVALYPVDPRRGNIWDEDRRGAIICLGKYAYNKETEVFLARHLDDWSTI